MRMISKHTHRERSVVATLAGVCRTWPGQTNTASPPYCLVRVRVSAKSKGRRGSGLFLRLSTERMSVLGDDPRRLNGAQCSSVLCAALLSHHRSDPCCSFCPANTHRSLTHTLACTLKTSTHTVGKTGVTDWMLPAEHFWNTHTHTPPQHTHCKCLFSMHSAQNFSFSVAWIFHPCFAINQITFYTNSLTLSSKSNLHLSLLFFLKSEIMSSDDQVIFQKAVVAL